MKVSKKELLESLSTIQKQKQSTSDTITRKQLEENEIALKYEFKTI